MEWTFNSKKIKLPPQSHFVGSYPKESSIDKFHFLNCCLISICVWFNNLKIFFDLASNFKSIAIIGKDMNECEDLEKRISKIRNDVKLIKGKDSKYNSGISIVPSYLAKGLEFDCVIITNASNKKYTDNSLDIKLLYVAITRTISKLDIFYIEEKSMLLI